MYNLLYHKSFPANQYIWELIWTRNSNWQVNSSLISDSLVFWNGTLSLFAINDLSAHLLLKSAAISLFLHQINVVLVQFQIFKADFTCPPWFSSSAKKLITRILDPNPLTVCLTLFRDKLHIFIFFQKKRVHSYVLVNSLCMLMVWNSALPLLRLLKMSGLRKDINVLVLNMLMFVWMMWTRYSMNQG